MNVNLIRDGLAEFQKFSEALHLLAFGYRHGALRIVLCTGVADSLCGTDGGEKEINFEPMGVCFSCDQ